MFHLSCVAEWRYRRSLRYNFQCHECCVGAMSVVNAKLLAARTSTFIRVSTVRVIAVRQLQHTTSPHFSERDGCSSINFVDRTRRFK